MKRSKNNKYWTRSILIGLGIFLVFTGVGLATDSINKVVNKTSKINDYKVLSEELLGINKPTRVLILFQNNSESRPGGGFIGTIGYITIDKGKIKPEPVRSSYYYDYQVRKIREQYQSEGRDIDDINYTIRDSGQKLDWPTNARSAMKLFELQPGKDVDMVIGLTPEVLKYLLKETGPIYLEKYQIKVGADNILETLQQEVEYGQDKAAGKDPKTVLSEAANQVIQRLTEKSILELSELGGRMQDLLRQRQVTIYSKDYGVGTVLKRFGYDGSLVGGTNDYFLLTENNYSIDKSNAFIDRKLSRNITINPDGGVGVEVKIIRTQTIEQSFPYVDPRNEGTVTHLVRPNKSYMQFAVPKSSKIVSTSSNITLEQVDSEGGYDIYRFPSELTPLVTSEYIINYQLPFIIKGDGMAVYNSYLQYQNGGWPYGLRQTIQVPEGWELDASNRSDLTQSNSLIHYDGKIDRDFYWSTIYAKK